MCFNYIYECCACTFVILIPITLTFPLNKLFPLALTKYIQYLLCQALDYIVDPIQSTTNETTLISL